MVKKSLKLSFKELIEEVSGEAKAFPKYTTQIMNLANQNAQGTRPKVVGQLSDLIVECPHREYGKWREWYLKRRPSAVDDAAKKVFAMVEELKKAINRIDERMVKLWVEDLVIDKTFIGLRFQEGILGRVAHVKGQTYRLANKSEESKGIDGFIGRTPVSIKPVTYKSKKMLNEQIKVALIYYEKRKDGVAVDLSEFG